MFRIGDRIEVVDFRYYGAPMRGEIIELDADDFRDEQRCKIAVDSPALPAPQIWVNLRLARKINV